MDVEANGGSGQSAAAAGTPERKPVRPRLWPPVLIVVLQITAMVVCSLFFTETPVHFFGLMLGPPIGLVLLLLWWLFASRVPVWNRVAGLLITAGAAAGAYFLADESMMVALMVYGLATLTTVVTVVLIVTSGIRWPARRWVVLATAVAVCLVGTTLRLDGLDGSFLPELSLRWSATPEEKLLETAESGQEVTAERRSPEVPLEATALDWPEFRGPRRDGKLRGVTFASDWSETPPRELWRRRVGPGWSSFAVVGSLIFTQEQRGSEELVVCYALEDGAMVWTNRVETRFEETVGGPGPRATPTFAEGRLFALGANGTLQCLDPANGKSLWTRDLRSDTGASVPTWGFSSSPLVVGDLVVVFAGGRDGESVVAYERESGEQRWASGTGTLSYSSCHGARIADVDQILMASDVGIQAFDPASGVALWEHRWELTEMARIVQPLVLGTDSVFLATGYGRGTRRLTVTRNAGAWSVESDWTSRALKPYFNDFVEHEGHCYGFDSRIFACVDAKDGKRKWKGGRYGHGQVLLVVDLGLLLVASEGGDVVLVEASPAQHKEVARLQALEGKTWNHPVIARGRLLVRNGTEAACFELPGT